MILHSDDVPEIFFLKKSADDKSMKKYLACEQFSKTSVKSCLLKLFLMSKHQPFTVLPAKSDSDVLFCLHSCRGLIINRSLLYLSYQQDRINTKVIYRFALAQVECAR